MNRKALKIFIGILCAGYKNGGWITVGDTTMRIAGAWKLCKELAKELK